MGITLSVALFSPGSALGAAATIIIASAAVGAVFGITTQIMKTVTTIKTAFKIKNKKRRRLIGKALMRNSARLTAEVLMLFIHVKIGFEIIGLETVLGGEAAMFGLAIAGLALIALSLMIRVDAPNILLLKHPTMNKIKISLKKHYPKLTNSNMPSIITTFLSKHNQLRQSVKRSTSSTNNPQALN